MRRITFLFLLCLVFSALVVRAEDIIPQPAKLIDEGKYDIINVLLIGAATANPDNPGMTDSLMIVSINRTVGTVSIVSVPRDIFVYVPGFGMNKINTAYFYGEMRDENNTGLELLKKTIKYNLGVEIDYYARINFDGFMRLIDSVGGIQITVDCAIQDWKLKAEGLDQHDPENWELYTVRAGIHNMDSLTALWYVRSRRTSSDIDRGRRQQDVLRALWRKLQARGLLEHVPELWDMVTQYVQTDLTLPDIVNLMPLAVSMDTSDVNYYTFRMKKEVNNAYSDAGQQILLPDWGAVARLMQQVIMPSSSVTRPQRPTVAIVNASNVLHLDYVAADRLELEGFDTVVLNEWSQPRDFNKIVDFTGASKGSPISVIQKVLSVTDDGLEMTPDAAREYDYKVYIGWNYQFWACTRGVIQPPPPEPDETVSNN